MEQWELDVVEAAAASIDFTVRVDEDGAFFLENAHGSWVYNSNDPEAWAQALDDIAAYGLEKDE